MTTRLLAGLALAAALAAPAGAQDGQTAPPPPPPPWPGDAGISYVDAGASDNGAAQCLSAEVRIYGRPNTEYRAELWVCADPDPDTPVQDLRFIPILGQKRTTGYPNAAGYGTTAFHLITYTEPTKDATLPRARQGWKWYVVVYGPGMDTQGFEFELTGYQWEPAPPPPPPGWGN